MITGIQQPSSNSIRLDSQTIRIEANTDNEDTLLSYHITSDISALLSMPKYNKFSAIIDLKGIVRNRTPKMVKEPFSSWLYKVVNIYKIKSYVTEHKNNTSISVQNLNDFKIMYSIQELERLQDDDFYFLGISEALCTSQNATLSIPFFVNSNSLLLSINDQDGETIVSSTTQVLNGYYVFEYKLQLDYNVEYLIVTLRNDVKEIQKKIRVLKNTLHKPVNVRFINQFGALIYAQLFGEIAETPNYKNAVYTNHNGQMYNAEVEVESHLTINTGYLFDDEKFIIEQLLTSLNIEVEYNGVFKKVVANTKSIKSYVSNQWIYSNLLTFKFNKYETS